MSEIVRFTRRQRAEHLAVMTLFLLLALTGFPQKFFQAGLSGTIVRLLGGLPRVRFVHRVCGIVFAALTVSHLVTSAFLVLTGRARASLVPRRRDFQDAVTTLRYYLGLSQEQARFDHFDYRQKFEYWGLVLGGTLMVVTGFLLYFPTFFTGFLPGQVIPAAKAAHSSEGLMAFLIVVTWHVYNAHLNPDIFPFDKTIFTGRITTERMRHEHALELERLEAEGRVPAPPGDEKPPSAHV